MTKQELKIEALRTEIGARTRYLDFLVATKASTLKIENETYKIVALAKELEETTN